MQESSSINVEALLAKVVALEEEVRELKNEIHAMKGKEASSFSKVVKKTRRNYAQCMGRNNDTLLQSRLQLKSIFDKIDFKIRNLSS